MVVRHDCARTLRGAGRIANASDEHGRRSDARDNALGQRGVRGAAVQPARVVKHTEARTGACDVVVRRRRELKRQRLGLALTQLHGALGALLCHRLPRAIVCSPPLLSRAEPPRRARRGRGAPRCPVSGAASEGRLAAQKEFNVAYWTN